MTTSIYPLQFIKKGIRYGLTPALALAIATSVTFAQETPAEEAQEQTEAAPTAAEPSQTKADETPQPQAQEQAEEQSQQQDSSKSEQVEQTPDETTKTQSQADQAPSAQKQEMKSKQEAAQEQLQKARKRAQEAKRKLEQLQKQAETSQESASEDTAETTSSADQRTDQEVQQRLQTQLKRQRVLDVDNIDIQVNNGRVVLVGTVNSPLAKQRAVTIAESVRGVRKVDNRLQVMRPNQTNPVQEQQATDNQIREAVMVALKEETNIESDYIDVTVENRIVTLEGEVHSRMELLLAESIARRVPGVRSVRPELDIQLRNGRDNEEIAQDVLEALRWDNLVNAQNIKVDVQDNVVILTGMVGTAAEKRRARMNAWVSGVRMVDADDLEVSPWKDNFTEVTPERETRTDEALQVAVKNALMRDPRVFSNNIMVEVLDGRVSLTGSVDNLKSSRAAAQVTRSIYGVTEVINQITIAPNATVNNELLTATVRDAIIRDPYLDRYQIGVNIFDNKAYLTGTVDTLFEKAHAEDVVAAINGIMQVVNELKVEQTEGARLPYNPYADQTNPRDYDWYVYRPATTTLPDVELKSEIESELWWSPFVDSRQILVSVENGIATLTGVVSSTAEMRSAEQNALEAGAKSVVNNLTVAR
ncbi:BON domain-containing protein [Planctomycetales bacterium 10988]|nr:BON domain-containing protein [Planctomycetales bacterium 10988]